MSEPSDGDGSEKPPEADPVQREIDVPSTRKQGAVKLSDAEPADSESDGEPPSRPSSLDLEGPLTFPDDGPISARVRHVDRVLGVAEQGLLVALLVAIVLFAGGNALLDKIAGIQIHLKDEIIRGGTFAIALLGAAFATQQSRHLAMDLVSRRLTPRARLFLKVVLSLFIVFVVALMVRAGYHTVKIQKPSDELIFSPTFIAWLIPVGGALIILHTLFHIIIDVDYILRHKTPPERMRSGH